MSDALLGVIAGVLISLLTTIIQSEYSLRRLRAEQDREDAREVERYERDRTEEALKRRKERLVSEISALEQVSFAASRLYVLADQLGKDGDGVSEARGEFAQHSGYAYRYPHIAEYVEAFKGALYYEDFQDLLIAIENEISGLRQELDSPAK